MMSDFHIFYIGNLADLLPVALSLLGEGRKRVKSVERELTIRVCLQRRGELSLLSPEPYRRRFHRNVFRQIGVSLSPVSAGLNRLLKKRHRTRKRSYVRPSDLLRAIQNRCGKVSGHVCLRSVKAFALQPFLVAPAWEACPPAVPEGVVVPYVIVTWNCQPSALSMQRSPDGRNLRDHA